MGTDDSKRRTVDLARAALAVEDFLRAIGAPLESDPELRGSGARVAEAFANDLLSGYDADPAQILGEHVASRADGLVVVSNLSAATLCPHHLLPATGVVHVGYWPSERVVGLGALGKLVDCFTRRLALQEDIAANVADALVAHLSARGSACIVDMEPTCMTVRGEKRHAARASVTVFRGAVATDASMREAFLSAVAASTKASG